ncbi:MAG TPA: DUF1993 domain-containing protein [Burkholderiaceae bacterium]|jgi:hypothetical protein|nr:DUF1993 domain-containing protein [Burkholderiaceae bacterium]
MAISMYACSVPVFQHILGRLSTILEMAEAHAAAKKIDPGVLLQARLFPDMFTLRRQVLIATDFAKGACARLAGVEAPKHEGSDQTFEELRMRMAKTMTFLDALTAAQIDGSEERDITIHLDGETRHFKGQAYLLHFALPNFYFHVVTAYAILRHNGVELGKPDSIIGPF